MTTELKKFQNELEEAAFGKTLAGHCVQCKKKFSQENTHSEAGWKETRISKMCEDCFDALFAQDEEGS